MAVWQRIFRLSSSHRWRCPLHPAMADHRAPPPLSSFVRSFAAPVMPTLKPKPEAPKETRLNQAITARFVRLVTDEGHRVVPIKEALDCAMKLNLDLVEVQRTSNPPVCKIMDFHKEKYIQETKEKERKKLQSKIRAGDNKEVRFKSKTELKDLKIKADGIIRLMERGYRVKCMAVPMSPPAGQKEKDSSQKRKKVEDFEHKNMREEEQRKKREEELRSQLSRLLALIEDVAIVESGPHVVEKQAYAIVRHIKFRPKKAGKKSVKPLDAVSEGLDSAVTNSEIDNASQDEMSLEPEEEWESIECSSETDESEDTSPKEDLSRIMGRLEPADINRSKPLYPNLSPNPVLESLKTRLVLNKDQTDVKHANSFSVPSATPVVETNRYSKQRSTGWMPPHAAGNETERQGKFDPKFGQFNHGTPSSPSPSYGQFGPKHRQFNPSNPSSPSPSNGRFDPKHRQSNPGNFSSPSPSYGIFSAREHAQKAATSVDQNHLDNAANRDTSPRPSPSYGIFSTPKAVPSSGQKNLRGVTPTFHRTQ